MVGIVAFKEKEPIDWTARLLALSSYKHKIFFFSDLTDSFSLYA